MFVSVAIEYDIGHVTIYDINKNTNLDFEFYQTYIVNCNVKKQKNMLKSGEFPVVKEIVCTQGFLQECKKHMIVSDKIINDRI